MVTSLPPGVARQIEERARVLDQLRFLLVEHLRVDRSLEQIDPNAPLFTGGLGVNAVELDRHLETTFGVSLLDGAVVPRTVGAVVDLVLERMRANRHDSIPVNDVNAAPANDRGAGG